MPDPDPRHDHDLEGVKPWCIERVQSRSDFRRLRNKYGRGMKIICISRGEIEISLSERDQVIAYIEYLEGLVPLNKRITTKLSDKELVALEYEQKSWIAAGAAGGHRDTRTEDGFAASPMRLAELIAADGKEVSDITIKRARKKPHYTRQMIEDRGKYLADVLRRRT